MTEPRQKRSSKQSHPRLQALGWDRDDPTTLNKKGLAKLEECADEAAKKVSEEIEATKRQAART
jgi:hypothetical protein